MDVLMSSWQEGRRAGGEEVRRCGLCGQGQGMGGRFRSRPCPGPPWPPMPTHAHAPHLSDLPIPSRPIPAANIEPRAGGPFPPAPSCPLHFSFSTLLLRTSTSAMYTVPAHVPPRPRPRLASCCSAALLLFFSPSFPFSPSLLSATILHRQSSTVPSLESTFLLLDSPLLFFPLPASSMF